jgi:hypothetical protein
VDENILAGLALDEPKPFAGIEPLHCSLFSHLFAHFVFKLFVLLDRLQPQSKGAAKAWNSQPPLTNLKVLREQQTQPKPSTIPP